MTDRCFKHPRRKARHKWKVCSDDRWHGVCTECDLELNRIGLKWAYPMTWQEKFKAYERSVWMKKIGIPIGLATLKDGKVQPIKKYPNASARIAAKKSKRVRVKRMGGT